MIMARPPPLLHAVVLLAVASRTSASAGTALAAFAPSRARVGRSHGATTWSSTRLRARGGKRSSPPPPPEVDDAIEASLTDKLLKGPEAKKGLLGSTSIRPPSVRVPSVDLPPAVAADPAVVASYAAVPAASLAAFAALRSSLAASKKRREERQRRVQEEIDESKLLPQVGVLPVIDVGAVLRSAAAGYASKARAAAPPLPAEARERAEALRRRAGEANRELKKRAAEVNRRQIELLNDKGKEAATTKGSGRAVVGTRLEKAATRTRAPKADELTGRSASQASPPKSAPPKAEKSVGSKRAAAPLRKSPEARARKEPEAGTAAATARYDFPASGRRFGEANRDAAGPLLIAAVGGALAIEAASDRFEAKGKDDATAVVAATLVAAPAPEASSAEPVAVAPRRTPEPTPATASDTIARGGTERPLAATELDRSAAATALGSFAFLAVAFRNAGADRRAAEDAADAEADDELGEDALGEETLLEKLLVDPAKTSDVARSIQSLISDVDAKLAAFSDEDVRELLMSQKRDLEEMLCLALDNKL